MKETRIFQIQIGNEEQLATKNIVKGTKTRKEKIVIVNNEEFLEWNPYKSKLAAAIRNGLQILPIIKNSKVVCINLPEESTILHISNIVGSGGSVFVIDVNKNKKSFLNKLVNTHKNIIPIYDTVDELSFSSSITGKVDALYVDIPESEQIEQIVEKYGSLLKNEGFLMLIAKKDDDAILENDLVGWMAEQRAGLNKIREITAKLKSQFEIIQEINLGINYAMEPYHKLHAFILAQYLHKN
jgi:fibrillarin-like pre-rRNA processing protein